MQTIFIFTKFPFGYLPKRELNY